MKDGAPARRIGLAFRSVATSLAMLAPALWLLCVGYTLYLLLLLDVGLPAHSAETIIGLTAIVGVLLFLHAALLRLRRRIFRDFARAFDDAMVGQGGPEIDRVRAALVGGGTAALIDVVAVPILLSTLALIIGLAAAIPLLGASAIGIVVAWFGRSAGRLAMIADDARMARERGGMPQAAPLAMLGLGVHIKAIEVGLQRQVSLAECQAAHNASALTARSWLIAGLCIALMAAVMTWLTANGAASHGALAAALLLTIFILEPLMRLAGHLPALAAAMPAWRALRAAMADVEMARTPIVLPPPTTGIDVEAVAVPVHGTRRLMLQNVSFAAAAGDVVAVIGPADVGKSTLLKLLGGEVRSAGGTVRLDGAALDQWSGAARARYIGYLPQLPQLMPGTVAQNISRFQPDADPAAITHAATAAGAHDAIVRLPAGYDTMLGGADLPPPAMSVQQRISLARALFGEPFLLLLDSPSAFQDAEGEAALRRCLAGVAARGAVTIVVGDSAAIIESANRVLVLRRGGMADFGTKDDVRARMIERRRREAERLPAMPVCADASRQSHGGPE